MAFPHESLPVYRAAVALLVTLEQVYIRLPTYRYYLVDQIRRAALSVMLNIAEGAAEAAIAEKVRFYRMARRSVAEINAALDAAAALEPERVGDLAPVKAELARLFDELTRLMRTQRARRQTRAH